MHQIAKGKIGHTELVLYNNFALSRETLEEIIVIVPFDSNKPFKKVNGMVIEDINKSALMNQYDKLGKKQELLNSTFDKVAIYTCSGQDDFKSIKRILV